MSGRKKGRNEGSSDHLLCFRLVLAKANKTKEKQKGGVQTHACQRQQNHRKEGCSMNNFNYHLKSVIKVIKKIPTGIQNDTLGLKNNKTSEDHELSRSKRSAKIACFKIAIFQKTLF